MRFSTRALLDALGSRGGERRSQRGVLGEDGLVRLRVDGRLRDRCDLTDRLGVLEVGVDRRDDDASFDRDEVDADQRNADPRVDDDPLVEDAIEHVDETRSA